MRNITSIQKEFFGNGFAIIGDVYSNDDIESIINCVENADTSHPTFRKSTDLFAIRQFLKEIPKALPLIFINKLKSIIDDIFGSHYFLVKSIYFDKPGDSNWFVSYHQDLTISVDKKVELEGFGPWTVKHDQYSVQPPLHIMEDNFTIRIHLDDTDENNGALRVIPNSHTKGVYRPETIDWSGEKEIVCSVPRGGIMIMRPLLLHASSRTTSNRKRRVVHLEFSKSSLPNSLRWSELNQMVNTKTSS